MTIRDFRCALSGVSLYRSEVAVVLLEEAKAGFRPIGLPLWGRYEGQGIPVEIAEGPNADLIVGAFHQERGKGTILVEFERMGIAAQPMNDIESIIGAIACSQVGGTKAVRSTEGQLGFALLSAHVAAALMEGEPEISVGVALGSLADSVFSSRLGRSIYGPVAALPIKVRCKFGLSMAGLLALDQEMARLGIGWETPGEGYEPNDAQEILWLAEALERFATNAPLVYALEEYASERAGTEDTDAEEQ